MVPGSALSGDREHAWAERLMYEASGAFSTVRENPRENHVFAPLAVLITASGLQGEQPLVDRIM